MLDTTRHQLSQSQGTEIQQEVQTIYFEEEQASILHYLSDEIALLGEINRGGVAQKILPL